MEKNIEILDEIKQISPVLSTLKNKNVYSVSFSYFAGVADTIAQKIKSGLEPNYYFTNENVYSAPVGYFQNFSAGVMQRIKQEESKREVFEEMEAISPLLNSISKTPVNAVPNDYFETTSKINGTTATKEAKVVSLLSAKKIVRFAAAAVITGMLATGAFFFTQNQHAGTQEAQASAEVKKLSEQEIVDFLKTTSPADDVVSSTNGTNTKDNDIKSSVSEMSDSEIQQFLQENGEQDEM